MIILLALDIIIVVVSAYNHLLAAEVLMKASGMFCPEHLEIFWCICPGTFRYCPAVTLSFSYHT
jgi:hypothetical protein